MVMIVAALQPRSLATSPTNLELPLPTCRSLALALLLSLSLLVDAARLDRDAGLIYH